MGELYNFWRSMMRIRYPLLVLSVIELVLNISWLASSEVFRTGINAISAGSSGQLARTAILAVVVTIFYITSDGARMLWQRSLCNRMEEAAQEQIVNKLTMLTKTKRNQYTSGDLVTYLINHVTDGAGYSLEAFIGIFDGITLCGLGALYMCLVEWRVALVILVFSLLLRILTNRVGKKVGVYSQKAAAVRKANNNYLLDLLENMIVVRVFDRETWFTEGLAERENAAVRILTARYTWGNALNDIVWAAIKFAEYFIVLGFGGYLVSTGVTELGTLLAFIIVLDIFTKGINSFAEGVKMKHQAAAVIEDVAALLETGEVEGGRPVPVPGEGFNITFDHVSFSYGDQLVLKDISFEVKEAEKILIKGPNGQGKSTILNLLAGLYRPDQGMIRYGDTDITGVSLDEIARRYTYIPQNCHIITGNVYENLTLSEAYDEERCDRELQKMNLGTIAGTTPRSLSQGEKQRLNIARSLYFSDHKPLVLGDEIFANIDRENTSQILSRLAGELEDKTVFFVCHEEIPYQFDRIFHVENKTLTIISPDRQVKV